MITIIKRLKAQLLARTILDRQAPLDIPMIKCQRGNVAIMFALSLIPIVGCAGMGVDVALAYAARSRMSAALDEAALAVGSSNGTAAQLSQIAQNFFNANFPPGTLGTTPAVIVTVNGNTITASASAAIPTTIMKAIGINSVPVNVSSTVLRQINGLELAMVLDNTGSMVSNNNIQALRTAAQSLTDILFGGIAVHPTLKIGLVPYSAAVNPGSIAPSLITTNDTYAPTNLLGWKGCVIERSGADGIGDTPTVTWMRYNWLPAVDNNYSLTNSATVLTGQSYGNAATGPNLGCPTPITPLTNVYATVTSGISVMQAWSRGGTLGDIGMAWGLRVLSPDWPFNQGQPWGTPNLTKALILMTDGDNQFYKLPGTAGGNKLNNAVYSDYTGYGRLDELGRMGTTNVATAKTLIDTRLATMCQTLKAKGVVVYTITFASAINAGTKSIYLNCATDPSKYFDSPTQTDLQNAFHAIATELSNLRISQ
jgi:Flp pilus assembly protein TadG